MGVGAGRSTTAFGMVHFAAERVAMGILSVATWDVPPGVGNITGATLVISGLLTVLLTVRPAPDDATAERTEAAVLGSST